MDFALAGCALTSLGLATTVAVEPSPLVVQIDAGGISLDGERVVSLAKDGGIAEEDLDGSGFLATPVYERLVATRGSKGVVSVRAEAATPAELPVIVAYTAVEAGARVIRFGLRREGKWLEVDLPTPTLSSAEQEEPQVPPLNLVVTVFEDGYDIAGSGGRLPGPKGSKRSIPLTRLSVPCSGGFDATPPPSRKNRQSKCNKGTRRVRVYDREELLAKLGEIGDTFPDEKTLVIAPAPASDYGALIDVLRAVSAPPAGRGRQPFSDVRLSHGLSFEGAPGSSRSVMPVLGRRLPGAAPTSTGRGLSEVIAEVVEERAGLVRDCYERALLDSPHLTGRIEVEIVIAGTGSVDAVRIKKDELGSKPVTACVAAVLKGALFPPPPGGGLTVAYPFIFRRND